MLATAPHHPTPAPPASAPAPGPRPRGRWPALLVVLVSLGLVCSLGFTAGTARANPLLIAVPVAKAVGATAVSVLTAEGFSRMMDDGSDDTGGDDEDSKKKRGKWGEKLKGIPGLAMGLLGGLWGATEGVELLKGDGDGVGMPSELTEDLDGDDKGANYRGTHAMFTLDQATLQLVPTTVSNLPTLGLNVRGSCTKLAESTTAWCPENSEASVTVGNAYYNCFDTATGGWRVVSVPFIVNGATRGGCSTGGATPTIMPMESVVIRQAASNQARGLDQAYRVINPDFDWSLTGNGEASGISTITAEVQCTEVGTGNKQTVSKSVSAAGGVVPMAPCPTGWAPESIGWTETPRGGGTPEYLGGVKPKTPEAYPNCPPGECVRIVKVDGQPCNALRPECFDWMNTQPPTRVQCEFGPYNMPVAECADLEHIHKSTHGVTWGDNPETGQPEWLPAREDGTIDPTRIGTVYAPEDNPNRDYRPPVAGPVVKAPTEPSTPPSPTPTVPPPSIPPPVVNPPGGPKDPENPTKNCIAGMASWNPVDWIYTPVKCALSWAFIVDGDKGQSLIEDARAAFMDNGLGEWLDIPPRMFDGLSAAAGGGGAGTFTVAAQQMDGADPYATTNAMQMQPMSGGGCTGPTLTLPETLGGASYQPLNACAEPMSKYADMSRALITVVVTVAGMMSIINSLSVAFMGYRMFERQLDARVDAVNKT